MKSSFFTHGTCCLFLILIMAAPAIAAPDTFVEDFSTTQYMDSVNTTAWWDTVAGEIKLYSFQMSITGSFANSGTAKDVVIAHTQAFLADGSAGLVVVDVTDPAAPILTGSYDTSGDATALALAGDHAYVADGAGGMVVVDVSSPGGPVLAGAYSTGGDATGIAVDGDYAFVAAGSDGLVILDISDPTNPALAGSYVTTAGAIDIAVAGDHVFVAAGSAGLVIIDASDPTSPTLAGSYAAAGAAEAIAVDGDIALLAVGASGLVIVDIVDPTNPSFLGSVSTPAAASDVVVDGDWAYVAATGAGLAIVDIGDPSLPTLSDGQDTPGTAAGVTFAGAYAYLADGAGGLQVIEMRDTVPPTLWASHSFSGQGQGVEIAGDFAYLSVGTNGVEIVNISDPSSPSLAGNFDFGGLARAYDIAVAGNYAYVAFGDSGLVVLDVSDPTTPTYAGGNIEMAVNREAISLVVEGDFAYVVHELRGLAIFDIADPTSPTLVNDYNPALETLDVAVAGNYAYLACGDEGMHVVDITDPTTPLFASNLIPVSDSYLREISLEGDLALVAGSWAGAFELIFLLDISDPTSPVFDGGAAAGSDLVHDVISNGYLAIAAFEIADNYSGGFDLFDISDPTSLISPFSSYFANEAALGLEIAGDFVYLVREFRLEVVRIFDREYLAVLNRGRSLPIASEVAAVKLATTQTDSITWEVTSNSGLWVTATPDVWLPIGPFFGQDLLWRSTHIPTESGENPTCSLLEFEFLYSHANIDSIVDVPNDQGGWARVYFTRSGQDFIFSAGQISDYVIWRRVNAASGREDLSAYETMLTDFPPGIWEIVGSFPAMQQSQYIYLTPTQADSSAADPAHSVHLVTAHSDGLFWISPPDSGYSIDNIAPEAPGGFAIDYGGDGNALSWDPSEAEDFQYFNIYRDTTPEFTPTQENLVHSLVETIWFDPIEQGSTYHYMITALDHVGNESAPAPPELITGIDEPLPLGRLALYQNSPNPFNPRTTIRYDLAEPARVYLRVYDLSGRLARILVDGEYVAAGRHQVVWNGQDESGRAAATGIYFYRFEAGAFSETRRMLLVK